MLARHVCAQIGFSTTSAATANAAASKDFDFSEAWPIVAAGDTGVGTDKGGFVAIRLIGATAAPGGRSDVLKGKSWEC